MSLCTASLKKGAEVIDSEGRIRDVIKKIVLNSSEGDIPKIKPVDPLRKV
ncbi:MAG: hypothetical protein ACSNEK_09405 [Parachlamydiaceae bacterium]